MHQSEGICEFVGHHNQQITICCINTNCINQSAGCQTCITELHGDHVQDCQNIQQLAQSAQKVNSQVEDRVAEFQTNIIQFLQQFNTKLEYLSDINSISSFGDWNKFGIRLRNSAQFIQLFQEQIDKAFLWIKDEFDTFRKMYNKPILEVQKCDPIQFKFDQQDTWLGEFKVFNNKLSASNQDSSGQISLLPKLKNIAGSVIKLKLHIDECDSLINIGCKQIDGVGHACIRSDGEVLSDYNSIQNEVAVAFVFSKDDLIECVINKQESHLQLNNYTTGESYTLDSLPLDTMELYVVLRRSTISIIEI